jgi:hypothetical protein
MSLCTFIFKPKHDIELAIKPINSFVQNFLYWEDSGVDWDIRPVEDREGWYKLYAYQEGEGNDGFTECCWNEEEITPKQLTEDMMVLLVEAGICNEHKEEEIGTWYNLLDVELSQVISAVSEDDSYVYSPSEDQLWFYHVKTGHASKVSMVDFILSQTIPEAEAEKKQLSLELDGFSEAKESFIAP